MTLRLSLALVVTLGANALAQEYLPTPADLEAGRQSQAIATPLAPRLKALLEQSEAFDKEAERAGVTLDGTIYHLADRERPPEASVITALDRKLEALTTAAASAGADCAKWAAIRERIQMNGGSEYLMGACRNWNSSTGRRADCTVWQKLEAPSWPGDGACDDPVRHVNEMATQWKTFKHELVPAQAASKRKAELDSLYLQPTSGNPSDRAIVIPPKFRRETSRGRVIVDTVALFAAVHPSHFVFLRKNLGEAPQDALENLPLRFSRTLKKGEAVLTVRRRISGAREVELLTLDGNRGMVSVEDLAQSPLPGTRVVALTAADLNVLDEQGNAIAGPTWLEADNTGFSLDEPNAWLDLLEPQEPRATKFLEAKDKTLSCYQKQRKQLDPRGTLSKYFDIVTFGRNGNIQKVESAAAKFDRTACGACGCKAFNALKASYIKAAIAPAQKQAFEKYQPVIEQLLKTDFASASKGAPRGGGVEQDADEPL